MGKNFRETLNERMQDPAFRAEWDAQEPERQIMRAIVEGREERGMTQKQLSDITGITQADISRLERGTANPSLRTLKRLAAGMVMALKLEFVPTHRSLPLGTQQRHEIRVLRPRFFLRREINIFAHDVSFQNSALRYLNICSSWSSGLCPIASRLRCNS